jgi:EF hand
MIVVNFAVDLIELDSANKVFDSLPGNKDGDGSMVTIPDIINGLVTLYEPLAIHAPSSRDVNIPLSVDLVLNWLLNVYDR